MVEKAEALAKSTIPAEFNKKEVVNAVNKLAKDSKKLHQFIQKHPNDNEKIKKALSDLHDTFHVIVERCSKTSDKHE